MPLRNCRFCVFAFLALAIPVSIRAQITNSSTTNSAPVVAPAILAPPPVPEGLIALHDVVIGKGGAQDIHAEIAYPKDAKKPLPAIIFIHGGGWINGTHKNSPIFEIAKSGYFGASIEYRFTTVAKWPAQIQDCKLAVRWLRANAAKYNIDPNRIGVWGNSAGGHLATCLATMSDVKDYEGDGGYPGVSSAVQAVVDFYGPTDFINPHITDPQALKSVELLFGVSRDKNPDLWKSGSPLFYVKAGDPPTFIAHGDSDTVVPLENSTSLDAALAKAGVPHQLLIVKNAGHSFKPLPGTTIDPSRAEINKAVFEFFDKYLKTP